MRRLARAISTRIHKNGGKDADQIGQHVVRVSFRSRSACAFVLSDQHYYDMLLDKYIYKELSL